MASWQAENSNMAKLRVGKQVGIFELLWATLGGEYLRSIFGAFWSIFEAFWRWWWQPWVGTAHRVVVVTRGQGRARWHTRGQEGDQGERGLCASTNSYNGGAHVIWGNMCDTIKLGNTQGNKVDDGSASTNSFCVFFCLVGLSKLKIYFEETCYNQLRVGWQSVGIEWFDKDWTFLYSRVYSEFDRDGQELRPKTNKGRRALHWNIFPNTRQRKRGGLSGNNYVVVQSWAALAFFCPCLSVFLSFFLFEDDSQETIMG